MKTPNTRYGATLVTLAWLAATGTAHGSQEPAGQFIRHALTGERDKARELFEQALDLQSRRSNRQLRASAARNLALLDRDVIAAR